MSRVSDPSARVQPRRFPPPLSDFGRPEDDDTWPGDDLDSRVDFGQVRHAIEEADASADPELVAFAESLDRLDRLDWHLRQVEYLRGLMAAEEEAARYGGGMS